MARAEAGVDLRALGQGRRPHAREAGAAHRRQPSARSVARRRGCGGPGPRRAAMMITQLGALIGECKARTARRGRFLWSWVADRRWVASRGQRPGRAAVVAHPRGPERSSSSTRAAQGPSPAVRAPPAPGEKVRSRGSMMIRRAATTTTTVAVVFLGEWPPPSQRPSSAASRRSKSGLRPPLCHFRKTRRVGAGGAAPTTGGV